MVCLVNSYYERQLKVKKIFRALVMLTAGSVALLGLSACGQSSDDPSAANGAASADQLVLADGSDLGGYNPVNGYGELGVSPVYEGLVGLKSDDPEKLPSFRPVLAAELPEASDDFTKWTAKLRKDVKFHNGEPFTGADVVATYNEVLNPNVASKAASAFEMLKSVESETAEDGTETVTFTLNYPYPDFNSRLLLGIAPKASLTGGLASESPLNTEPIGTGPYKLESLQTDKAVWKAFPEYWGEQPKVKTFTVMHVPDDSTRASRTSAGEFDGAQIPPALAAMFKDSADYEVVKAKSADWRGLSLPADSVFTKDPQVRVAMNKAIDRDAIIEKVLAGSGSPAHTPVSSVYDSFDAKATFPYDPEGAKSMLDKAGWKVGADGIREKDGEKAGFTLSYSANDTVRRDLATAFADAMKQIGVDITLEGTSWEKLEPVRKQRAILLGGGDKPYSIDTQVYNTLHQNVEGTSIWNNPGNFGSPEMDALLDEARKSGDHGKRDELYKEIQQKYLENPGYVLIAFLDHNYVMKKNSYDTGNLIVEPHAHGVNWGPWWNLASWR